MRNIYVSAYVTYFWLGEAGRDTDKAIDKSTGNRHKWSQRRAESYSYNLSARFDLPALSAPGWPCRYLQPFLDRTTLDPPRMLTTAQRYRHLWQEVNSLPGLRLCSAVPAFLPRSSLVGLLRRFPYSMAQPGQSRTLVGRREQRELLGP